MINPIFKKFFYFAFAIGLSGPSLANDGLVNNGDRTNETATRFTNQDSTPNTILHEILADLFTKAEKDITDVLEKENDSSNPNPSPELQYLLYWKRALLKIDSKNIESIILNNRYSVSPSGTVSIDLTNTISVPLTPMHDDMVQESALISVSAFSDKAKDEARQVAKKHYVDDMRKWRRQGKFVPREELLNRIGETPHFHALLVLQKLFSNDDPASAQRMSDGLKTKDETPKPEKSD